jgi:hypothetical protein
VFLLTCAASRRCRRARAVTNARPGNLRRCHRSMSDIWAQTGTSVSKEVMLRPGEAGGMRAPDIPPLNFAWRAREPSSRQSAGGSRQSDTQRSISACLR